MHNVIYFMTGCMFTFTRDGTEISNSCLIFQTALHAAVCRGKEDVVETLLRNGADINEKAVSNHKKKSVGGDGKTERQSDRKRRIDLARRKLTLL